MDLEQLFLKRQSTREYSDRPVPREELERICRLARLAPSAVNSQPYKLHIVTGGKAKEFCKYVQILGSNRWASGCPAFIAMEQGKPAVVERLGQRLLKTEFVPIDIGIAAAYIVLAAENDGVQTCILGMRDEKGIAEFLGAPEGTKYPLVIALGYAPEGYPVREKNRRPFGEAVDVTE